MVHLGYIAFGGEEVANTERLQAYVDNGLVPDGTIVEACEGCEGLGHAQEGPGFTEYRTPMLDNPGWMDPGDPDSWDFAGVLPLAITGADTSVSTVDVTPTIGDGGVAGSRRRGPRTIAVSAMLIGRTTEAVQVGLSWLQRMLYRGCDDDDTGCAAPADLTLFTSCPGPLGETYDDTATAYATVAAYDDDDWWACNGFMESDGGRFFYPYTSGVIDGGDPDGPWDAASSYTLEPYGLAVRNEDDGPPEAGGLVGSAPQWTDSDDATYTRLAWNTNSLGTSNNDHARGMLPESPLDPAVVNDVVVHVRASADPHAISSDATLALTLPGLTGPVGDVLLGVSLPLDGTLADYDMSVLEWLTPLVGATDAALHIQAIATWVAGAPRELRVELAGTYILGPPVGTGRVAELTVELASIEPIDGGDPDGPWEEPAIDGGGPGPIPGDLGALVAMTTRTHAYVGGPLSFETDAVLLEGAAENATLQWAIIDPTTCDVLLYGPTFALLAADAGVEPTHESWSVGPNIINCDQPWAPAILSTVPFAVEGLTAHWLPELSPEECIAPYRRIFPDAVVVDGPTVVEVIDNGDCGQFYKVEWTWVTGTGFRFGTPRLLAGGLQNATSSYTYRDPEVIYISSTGGAADSDGGPVCEPPSALAASCSSDPGSPAWMPPPALPVVPDPDRVVIGTRDVGVMFFVIPPTVTPSGEGVLTFKLSAPTPLQPNVGVRVRVYEADTAVVPFDLPDRCAFLYEYTIDYIPGGGTLTIDGRSGAITTLCPGELDSVDASNVVRGNYDGPVLLPVVKCNRRYMVVVEYLGVYPRTVVGVYTEDAPQLTPVVDVSLSLREG